MWGFTKKFGIILLFTLEYSTEENDSDSKQDEELFFADEKNNESDQDEELEDSFDSDTHIENSYNKEIVTTSKTNNVKKTEVPKESNIFSDSDQDVFGGDSIKQSNDTNSTESDEFEDVE